MVKMKSPRAYPSLFVSLRLVRPLQFALGAHALRLALSLALALSLSLAAAPTQAEQSPSPAEPPSFTDLRKFRHLLSFDRELEFPNPLAGSWHSDEALLKQLGKTVYSVAQRVRIYSENNGSLQHSPLTGLTFAAGRPQEGTVFLAGDGVRDLLAYVFEQMAEDRKGRIGSHPNQDPWSLLRRIERNSSPIEPEEVFRLGSEIRLVVGSSRAEGLLALMNVHWNSARTRAQGLGVSAYLTDLRFPPFRAQSVSEFLGESEREGTYALHSLLMDLKTGRLSFTVSDGVRIQSFLPWEALVPLVHGHFGPVVLGTNDPGRRVLKAVQLMLQFPFLDFERDQKKNLLQDLHAVNTKWKSGRVPEPERLALEQLIWIHAAGGVHNRFTRGMAGASSGDLLERELKAQVRQLLELREGRDKGWIGGLPYFARSGQPVPPPERVASSVGWRPPRRALLDLKEFMARHTDHGWLYHGTDGATALLRCGLPQSVPGLGGCLASYGSGFYTTKDWWEAFGYKGHSLASEIVSVRVKPELWSRDPVILDYERLSSSDVALLEDLAAEIGKTPFQILSEYYGIDIIVNIYPLIQNAEVVELVPHHQTPGKAEAMSVLEYAKENFVLDSDWISNRGLVQFREDLRDAYAFGYDYARLRGELSRLLQTELASEEAEGALHFPSKFFSRFRKGSLKPQLTEKAQLELVEKSLLSSSQTARRLGAAVLVLLPPSPSNEWLYKKMAQVADPAGTGQVSDLAIHSLLLNSPQICSSPFLQGWTLQHLERKPVGYVVPDFVHRLLKCSTQAAEVIFLQFLDGAEFSGEKISILVQSGDSFLQAQMGKLLRPQGNLNPSEMIRWKHAIRVLRSLPLEKRLEWTPGFLHSLWQWPREFQEEGLKSFLPLDQPMDREIRAILPFFEANPQTEQFSMQVKAVLANTLLNYFWKKERLLDRELERAFTIILEDSQYGDIQRFLFTFVSEDHGAFGLHPILVQKYVETLSASVALEVRRLILEAEAAGEGSPRVVALGKLWRSQHLDLKKLMASKGLARGLGAWVESQLVEYARSVASRNQSDLEQL